MYLFFELTFKLRGFRRSKNFGSDGISNLWYLVGLKDDNIIRLYLERYKYLFSRAVFVIYINPDECVKIANAKEQ